MKVYFFRRKNKLPSTFLIIKNIYILCCSSHDSLKLKFRYKQKKIIIVFEWHQSGRQKIFSSDEIHPPDNDYFNTNFTRIYAMQCVGFFRVGGDYLPSLPKLPIESNDI